MTESPRVFDLPAAVEYVRGLGASGVSIYTLRTEIAAGRLPKTKLGKRFYISKSALDNWILRAERRARG